MQFLYVAVDALNYIVYLLVVSDSAVFAMMSRVNKVIVGTHAVMANGGTGTASKMTMH